MNVDKQIKKIQNEDIGGSVDPKSFLINLHHKRNKNDARRSQLINGIYAFCLLIMFSVVTVNQLAYEPGTHASVDLMPYQEMDAETESFVYDLADYLIVSSDDIWQTLDFFDEINLNDLIASNYGEKNE